MFWDIQNPFTWKCKKKIIKTKLLEEDKRNIKIVYLLRFEITIFYFPYIQYSFVSYKHTDRLKVLNFHSRPPAGSATAGLQMPRDCEQRCPELNACINASLWCDGVSHCPSGYDEALTHCSIILRLPPLHLGLAALVIVAIIALMCFVLWRIFRQRTNRSISQHRLKSISSETAIIDGKEVICWQNDSSVRYVEVDRVTTVWRSPPPVKVQESYKRIFRYAVSAISILR